jgi:heme exporter protein A
MLTVTDLACTRGERELFAGIDFALDKGAWLHLTGENGAGKTSLMRTLCGLSPPAAGDIHWGDTPIHELGDAYRANLLYIGHHAAVKDELSARENLQVSAAVKGWSLSATDAGAALQRIGLGEREDLPLRFLSQGQRRRAALAQLLVSREPLWLLDEPFAALDESAITSVTQIIAAHLTAGGVVVLTSHQPAALPSASKQALHLGA